MPKKTDTIITIKESLPLNENQVYEVLVKVLKINRRKNHLRIVLHNLNSSQYGREHIITLPLPACPSNPVCLFFESCGVDTIEIGKEIDLNSLIGKRLGVQFLCYTPPYDYRTVKFTKLQESCSHGNIPK